jgi:hypothetical protein
MNILTIFSVATCGADTGNAMELIKKEINNKGMTLNSGFLKNVV